MDQSQPRLLGVGIYTVPEAAKMASVSAGRIRRWLLGYTFKAGSERRASPPVWAPDLPMLGDSLALSFRDLIEVRFVDYFLRHGVSWKELRAAAQEAAKEVNSTHPFSTGEFRTDGKRILREYAEKRGRSAKRLLEVVRKQFNIPTVVAPYLYDGLEFADNRGHAIRWYPVTSRRVVIDPAIAFGQPTLSPEGVPTAVVARAYAAEQSIDRVAHWLQIPPRAVKDAVEYEDELKAA